VEPTQVLNRGVICIVFLNEIVRVLSISFPEILVLKACVVAESWQSVSTNFERNLFLDDNNSKIEFMYTQTY